MRIPFSQHATSVGSRRPPTPGCCATCRSRSTPASGSSSWVPRGAARPSCLRCLAFLDPLEEGTLRWKGATISRHQVPLFRSHVVYLHQRPSLVEGTVADNLKYPFSFAIHRGRRFDEQRVVGWLQSLGRPPEFLQKASRDLSGGEAQITALLRHATRTGCAAPR